MESEKLNSGKDVTDTALVRQADSGDVTGFEKLVERHFGGAYAVAFARLKLREPAEELTQEAFLTAYLNLKKLRDPALFGAWVCRIARNLALKWIRSGQRQSEMLKRVAWEKQTSSELVSYPADQIQARQEGEMLRAAIEDLSADQREAVLLHYGEELTKREIAQRMGVHPATVGRILERALVNLRSAIEPELRIAARKYASRPEATHKAVMVIGAAGAMSASAKTSLAAGSIYGGAKAGSMLYHIKWPLITAAGVLGIGAIVLSAPQILHFIFLKTRAPEMRSQIESYSTVPVNFPQAWTVSNDTPGSVTTKLEAINQEWNKIPLETRAMLIQVRDRKNKRDPDIDTTKSLVVNRTESLLKITSQTVRMPGYSLVPKIPNFTALQNVAQAATVHADFNAAQLKWSLAFYYALLPLHMARHNESDNLITQLIAIYMASMTAERVADLQSECPDISVLTRSLHELENARKFAVLGVVDKAPILAALSQLKEYREAGIPVSLEPGHPLVYYYEQLARHKKQYLEYKLKSAPAGSNERADLERAIETENEPGRQAVMRTSTDFLLSQTMPNIEEAKTREQVVSAKLDLASIALAQRIRELRGETTATRVAELVPEFLDTEPLDPFSGKPYPWDAAKESFYCVGPNKIDESRGFIYDATNGTYSPGDIRLAD